MRFTTRLTKDEGLRARSCDYAYNYFLNKMDPRSEYNSQPSGDRPDLAGLTF